MPDALMKDLFRELPYLRRYARAVTGDQEAGDAAVKRALGALLEGRAPLDDKRLRLSLYRALYRTHADVGAAPPKGTLANDRIVASRVGQIDDLQRHALVLASLEGLSTDQTAEVLGVSPEHARDLLAQGRKALRSQPATRILIIEDEPIIALDIATAVERNGHEVAGVAATHEEALALARAEAPGLVLADIQLADNSSGIDAANEILARHAATPVIFITAFPERLLTGERPEPAFLLTKPFDHETLNVAIAQALAAHRPPVP